MITKRVNVTRQSDKNKHAERGPGDMKRKILKHPVCRGEKSERIVTY